MWNIIVVFSVFALFVRAQISQTLQCDPNVQLQNGFNSSELLGEWYEIARAANEEQPGECSKFTFLSENGNDLVINNVAINKNFREESNSSITETEPSKFIITRPGSDSGFDFWILTSTEDFVVGFNCVNNGNVQRNIRVWVLARESSLPVLMTNFINTQLQARLGILYNDLAQIDHSENACYELPVIPSGSPIILPGQCTDMTLQPNFNVTAFTGEWFELGSYESENVVGTCPRAEYTLVGNDVIVTNSIVQNQTLYTVSGSASVIENSKLSVVLEVNGVNVTQELWIIETDYTNYAVTYSCVNLPNNQKRVFTWMLSRGDTLSNESQESMNRVIDSHMDLNYRYYKMADQSDDACFYYPEPTISLPVIFRGQCDESIQAVDNFDPEAYQGLWYEIEKYPAPFQDGSCAKADYTLNNGIVDVINSQVVDESLDSIIGIAEIAPDANGTGKLFVSFPVAGLNLTTTTNYYVLATDYTSYTFVYSCLNLPFNQRQVFSWKLSRSKELTPNATAAIDSKIEEIDVLRQDYYEVQDQSPSGCFFYPEHVPGKPVVFPGQCDPNFAVMQNFNISRFEGVWHEIQTYPKEQVQGQCINYQYNFNNNNGLDLINSQVIDQFLSQSNGTVSYESNELNGKLTITITSNGQTISIPFWILDTDYDNYALAYSCSYINLDFRGIFAWKLGRSRQLSQNYLTAIDNFMEPIEVLNNGYFEDIDQTDDACFYLPELAAGEPVVLVGQCDPTLQALPNFNASRFEGLWRIIQGYPESSLNGTCNDANFSLLNNGFNVEYSDVAAEVLQTRLSSVTLAADGSARLLVQPSAADLPSEYLILDTDYLTYALVYACANLNNNNQRRVWSWKLSRTRDFDATANTAINQVIDRINVLNNRYYETKVHTDAACFYYPEPSNEPVIFRGQCDENIAVVDNFDAERYMNLWHEIQSYPSAFQFGSCSNANYDLVDGIVAVRNTMVVNERLETVLGQAVPVANGKLDVTFPVGNTNETVTTNYWVLATDYTSYALVYSCRNIGNEHRQVSSWKLSRTKTLSPEASIAIDAVTAGVPVLRQQYYRNEDQSPAGCFYYPEPQAGVVVVFPGQCDDSLPVVSDFNLTRFEGFWHEIQAYPKDEQSGQCINHDYTAFENYFNLQSSNVVEQTLFSSTSVATLTSNDGSAKLNIAVNNETNIPFWILDTDYNNYALAYSCVNRGIDYKAIYSWKLGRAKQLSPVENERFDAYFANVRELDNEYFEEIKQTDEDCFYLPDLPAGTTVVFPGRCDQNINAVPNFNAIAYQGRWRLIESYPSTFQIGECLDANYTIIDGAVEVYNTQVIDQTLDTITGSAIASTDGSGKLSVMFPGAPAPVEYWVLDTDYTSYSYVYSCIDLDDERRQVYSWKMSRTGSLSDSATTAINNIIDNINVLDARYYERIDQSDDACFYYPEPDSNRPVVFRGQCNESIPVVMNFDIGRYMNLWHDVGSYPQEFQFGSCPNALYTLTDNGVEVYNTQVVDQLLDAITGSAIPAFNDGSAKLSVTFPIAGTNFNAESPYWVLDTDYDTYALVYSCVNINEEERRVTSWKLSRNQTGLSAAATTSINNVINSIPVLRDDYYVNRGQSEADCFYYPDNFGGPVELDGQCEDNNAQGFANFNPNQFTGIWHEYARFPSELQNGECANTNFAASANGLSFTQSTINNELLQLVSGSATVANNTITATIINSSGVSTSIDLKVLDTDYSGFALLYGCRNLNENKKQIYSWKLSRTAGTLSPDAINRIDEAVSNNIDLHPQYYDLSGQALSDCFYYPDFDPLPPSIELLGPCDESIRGQVNFNVSGYLGEWIEIAKYPQPFQEGTCGRAIYSLSNSGVDVANTQVYQEQLLTQLGSAVVASSDGTGQLDVTFVLPNGVTNVANYYVLTTDYTNYALVYSCRNLDNGNRQVSSWKLSRTKTLSAEANAILDNVIGSTQGLRSQYYETTSQSDDDCFYVPEPSDNAVVFRGQCDTNVTRVQNFDLQRYIGWWHEIESYSTGENEGDCISAQFQSSSNTVQVVTTNVFDLSAEVNTGVATATNDGILRVTLPDGNVNEYWVLATDYESYSLLYSCQNIDDDHRLVWSAKHSKTRDFPSEAAVSPLIDGNKVLYPQLYRLVNQTDAACFYYPEVTGQQVILPGQCDESIEVEQAFDAVEYTGTWYQIEKYPQPFEFGNCTGARYSLDSETGAVNVLNWEVVDGELMTIEGNATVSSTDGSAKLTVQLPIIGTNFTTETELYVLKTDYVSYSLTYSCSNINTYQRSVGAWKLSRTRSLTSESVSEINAYIQTREELHASYFTQTSQSDECEQPSSALLVKSSALLLVLSVVLIKLF